MYAGVERAQTTRCDEHEEERKCHFQLLFSITALILHCSKIATYTKWSLSPDVQSLPDTCVGTWSVIHAP